MSLADEPKFYHDAIKSKDCDKWNKAMDEEYESIMKNNTWILVDPPENEEIAGYIKLKRKVMAQLTDTRLVWWSEALHSAMV